MPIVLSTRRRFVLLLTMAAVGFGVGLAGYLIGGSQAWFLAIPAAIAGAWLVVADPGRCTDAAPPRN